MLQVDNDKHQHRQGETHLYKNVPRNHHKKKHLHLPSHEFIGIEWNRITVQFPYLVAHSYPGQGA